MTIDTTAAGRPAIHQPARLGPPNFRLRDVETAARGEIRQRVRLLAVGEIQQAFARCDAAIAAAFLEEESSNERALGSARLVAVSGSKSNFVAAMDDVDAVAHVAAEIRSAEVMRAKDALRETLADIDARAVGVRFERRLRSHVRRFVNARIKPALIAVALPCSVASTAGRRRPRAGRARRRVIKRPARASADDPEPPHRRPSREIRLGAAS